MTEPVRMNYPVRLDDLIDAIKRVNDDALEQLTDAVLTAGWNFSADATAGSFTVPARTTAVFVEYN